MSFGLQDCHHDSDICQWGTRGKVGRGRGHKGLLRDKSVVRAYRCKSFIGFYSVLEETSGRLLSVFNGKAKISGCGIR